MSNTDYDVVALGARDYYEVSVALYKANRLHKLYTDWYTPDTLRALLKKRFNVSLPSSATRSFPIYALLDRKMRGNLFSSYFVCYTFGFLAAVANFLGGTRRAVVYSYYIEGFVGFYKLLRQRPRHLICFQVHPAPKFVQEAFARDQEAFSAIEPITFQKDPEAFYDSRALERYGRALQFCHDIVCASGLTRKSIFGQAGGVPISVVPYGSRFSTPAQPGAEIKRGDKIRLISVCQVTQRKGLHWAFHAMSQLPAGVQDVFDWVVIGWQRDPAIERLAPRNVRFEDTLSKDDLAGLLQQADLFVMPSILEGFGLVYIESLSLGTPIVYTAGTGAADFCVSGVHGYMVGTSNWQDIAAVFAECAKNPEQLWSLRPGCMDLARSIDWNRFHDGICKVCDGGPQSRGQAVAAAGARSQELLR